MAMPIWIDLTPSSAARCLRVINLADANRVGAVMTGYANNYYRKLNYEKATIYRCGIRCWMAARS